MALNSRKHRLLDFERRGQPLVPRNIFLRRMIYTLAFSFAILTGWVFVGMLGYHWLAQLSWVDSFLNTAMIVGGMGPVDILKSGDAKIFAGVYAIISGAMFLTVFALIAAPLFHRFLHRFHLEIDEKTESADEKN
jgi:hypothetical protein